LEAPDSCASMVWSTLTWAWLAPDNWMSRLCRLSLDPPIRE